MLVRRCSCKFSPLTCPAHRLESRLRGAATGQPLFNMTYNSFLSELRRFLRLLGVAQWAQYGSHALRRGSAQDLMEGGGKLSEVLQAGEWASRASLAYQNRHWLDEGALAEALCLNSEAE